jgi:hypothetical protein
MNSGYRGFSRRNNRCVSQWAARNGNFEQLFPRLHTKGQMSEVDLAGDSTAFLEVCVSKLVERFLRECTSVARI